MNDLLVINTNIEYQTLGLGKEYISNASRYPPRLDIFSSVGAYNPITKECTSHTFDAAISKPTQECGDFKGFEDIKMLI